MRALGSDRASAELGTWTQGLAEACALPAPAATRNETVSSSSLKDLRQGSSTASKCAFSPARCSRRHAAIALERSGAQASGPLHTLLCHSRATLAHPKRRPLACMRRTERPRPRAGPNCGGAVGISDLGSALRRSACRPQARSFRLLRRRRTCVRVRTGWQEGSIDVRSIDACMHANE